MGMGPIATGSEATGTETTTTTPLDEWVFTIRIPELAKPDADALQRGPQLVQMRQNRPRNKASVRDFAQIVSTPSSARLDTVDSQQQERLLSGEGHDGQQHRGPVELGWSLAGPYWTVRSNLLLKVTYFPAWQAMREYTNRCIQCSNSSLRSAVGSCSCCALQAPIDYMADVFTVRDVVQVESVPDYTIRGVGDCHTVRLHLRPLRVDHVSPIPLQFHEAWSQHVERIKVNRQKLGLHQKLDSFQHDDEEEEEDTSDDKSATVVGPVLTFCLPKSLVDPPLLWRVRFPARTTPIAVETFTVLDGPLIPRPETSVPTHIYINGYQSWSFTGSVVRGQPQPTSALPDVFSRAFNLGGQPPPPADTVISDRGGGERDIAKEPTTTANASRNYYTSDFFTCITSDGQVPDRQTSKSERLFPFQQLDETGGPALILGWLSQHQQLGVITSDKDLSQFQMHASAHQVLVKDVTPAITTDWAYAQLLLPHSYDEEPMVHYLHDVAGYNNAQPLQNGSLLTGWCSWYVFYERITAGILRENVYKLATMRHKVPTNVAVLDDGYMRAWGDWNDLKAGFPDAGLAVVSRDIMSQGMRPGLWLAPYAADKHSKVTRTHPDWIVRNDMGSPANSSYCGKFFYGLDATNPEVRAYVAECIRRAVEQWDFNVLKIDFLYAACLEGNGKYDLSLSRAQAMHLALQTIRAAAGPRVFLIGCGCPIGSGIGFVDAMRVSADTGPTWYPARPLPWWDQGTLPALRSMVRNSIARAPLGHRWWHNDPDCLMLGEHTRLTDQEVASAATVVAMTCGMLLLSDDLPKVSPTRMAILSKIFPLTGIPAVVLDLHSTKDGLPSLMRLWATDKHNLIDSLRESMELSEDEYDHNAEATFFARMASFSPNENIPPPNERRRSCLHMTRGLGTWTVVSISNWSDKAAVLHIPPPALLPPPDFGWENDESDSFLNAGEHGRAGMHGFHVLAFWSSRYLWLPDHRNERYKGPEQTLSTKLLPHETEIFHIKPVTPNMPQYIGSDLHFTCGQEVRSLSGRAGSITIVLKTQYQRAGHVFIFIPRTNTDQVRASVCEKPTRWTIVGTTPKVTDNGSPQIVGRVIQVAVLVHGDDRPHDGVIRIDF